MNSQRLAAHPYITELLELERAHEDRRKFHEAVKPLLVKMGNDKVFLKEVIRRNFDDKGYTGQLWSMYNIPYFLVWETDDLVLKIHLFPRAETYKRGQAAHAIHHHNNYLLTTYAFFGSGYETFLFEKEIPMDKENGRSLLKVRKNFEQKDWNPSMVDAWEPHVVFVPETLSATILVWTPEKKRSTDALRNVGFLKQIKGPLRKVIQKLGLENTFGIAKANTCQYYPAPDGNAFVAIEEETYFAPSKADVGDKVNDYCMQMVFSFLQQAGLAETDYLRTLLHEPSLPAYYKPWIQKVVDGETISEVYQRRTINVPQENYTRQDILNASKQGTEFSSEKA
jgi:hypothetical protein